MASSLIGALKVALGLDTAQFEAGAEKAKQRARQTAGDIEKSFGSAKRAIEGLFAAFTVGLITEQIKKSLDYAGSLAEVSRTLGVTTKDLQTFRFAATQSGVAQDQLEIGLRRLTVSIGKAELGSKENIKAFNALGISVDQLKGKTTGDVFRMMADGLSKVKDRAQRAAIEVTQMGRTGSTLDNLLAPGAARLNELAEAAQRLGIVLSDSQIQGAEETAHKLEAVKQVLSAQIAGIVANNAGAILSLSSALATLTGSIIKFLGSNPELALGVIGTLLGGRVGGLPGAVLGGAAGALLGGQVANAAAESNSDIGFRRQQVISARDRLREAERSGGAGPAMSVAGIQTGGGAAPNLRQLRNDLQHQVDLLNNAVALSKAQPAPKGVDLPKIFAGGGGGRQHRPPKDKNEEDEFQFLQEQRQLDIQILEAKKSLSHDVSDQAEISLHILDLQQQAKNAEINHKVALAARDLADHKIIKGTYDEIVRQAGINKAREADLAELQRKAILDERDQQLLQQSIQLDSHGYDLRREALQTQANLAETQSERRAIELQLLDLAYKEKRIMLDRIIAESKDPIAVAQAQQDRAALAEQYSLDRQGVIQQTRGPLEQYTKSLPTDAARWQEALQGVAVNGFGALEQAILDTVDGTKSLAKAFADMAKSIIADLLKISIERSIIAPLANALFPNQQVGLGGGGGLFGMLGGLFGGGIGSANIGGLAAVDSVAPLASIGVGSSFAMLPGFAGGGTIMVGGNTGIDKNLLSLNNVPIARVNYGEPINIGNDNSSSMRAGDIRIHAPITINSPVTRETAGQLGRELNARIAQSRAKGF